ncbi:tol-pal system protein YbgF [bacterium]|nr:tol-pal system protein YbgF [bacterium]MBU1984646.1 tol-pal system protein YbgF [bacterium]
MFERPLQTARALRVGSVWISILGALLLTVGCASRKQVFVIQEDTRYIRMSVDSLKRQQKAAQEALASLDDQVRAMRATAEYGSSTLEEKVETLASRLDEILTRMDRALSPLEEFMRRQAVTDTSVAPVMGSDYYDAAVRDLGLGNYDLAEVGFLQFLENYPKSDLADDARYGLAETHYARKKYDEAADEFRRVIATAPSGNKTPAAMLKLGLCYRAMQDNREARKTWEDLITKFPYSDEAKVARQRLDEIGGGR